jgi:DNA-binding response OmpR family regulator
MKKKRVLLLESDVILGACYVEALSEDGFLVDWAKTAEGAIRLADKHTPDVVVVELQIAEHNGVEFLYEFKSYAEWITVPVVVHTQLNATEIASVAALPVGLKIVAVLHKSHTSLTELCNAVEEAARAT